MDKRIVSSYLQNKAGLDDDYYLYEDGSIKRKYDRSSAPGNFNLEEIIKIGDLRSEIKLKLFENADVSEKELVKVLLGI